MIYRSCWEYYGLNMWAINEIFKKKLKRDTRDFLGAKWGKRAWRSWNSPDLLSTRCAGAIQRVIYLMSLTEMFAKQLQGSFLRSTEGQEIVKSNDHLLPERIKKKRDPHRLNLNTFFGFLLPLATTWHFRLFSSVFFVPTNINTPLYLHNAFLIISIKEFCGAEIKYMFWFLAFCYSPQ